MAIERNLAVWRRFILGVVTILALPGILSAQVWLQPSGPEGGLASCLASSDHVLLAGSLGLLKSADSGQTWQALPTNLSFAAITLFQGALFALAAPPLPFTRFALMRSVDRGQTWSNVEGVGGPYSSLALLFTDGANLYVGVDSGIASSPDGIHWSDTPDFLQGAVEGFASAGGQVFGGVGTQIERTSDGGHTWSPTAFPTAGDGFVTALGSLGDTLFAGIGRFSDSSPPSTIARSLDGGKTWSSVAIGSWVSAFGQAGSTLLAGLQNGSILRTDDGGVTWSDSSAGLPAQNYIYAFYVFDSSVFVATARGVYESDDEGRTWTVRRTGYERSDVSLLAASNSALFAQTSDGLKRSPDGGATWFDTGFAAGHLFTSDENVTYGIVLASSTNSQLARSTDNGATWDLSNPPFVVNGLALWKGLVFAATENGVFSSADGLQWASATGNLPSPQVISLRGAANALLAELSDGELYRSVDGGVSWTKSIIADAPTGSNFLPLQDTRDVIYSGGFDGFFQSLDGGATWQRIGDAPPGVITSLTVFNGEVFASCQHLSDNPAALYHMGVFALQSDGSWAPVNRGLLSLEVSGLAVAGGNLFAGVEGGGVQKFQSGRSTFQVSPALPILPAPINVGHRFGPNP